MDEDGIELASCARERDQAGSRPLVAALIDSCGDRQTAASILLRGSDGDEPTLTAIAVDTRQGIETLLGEEPQLARPGLVTLTPTRLLSGEIEPVWLGEGPGEATRLTLYCGHQDRAYQVPAFEAACELLYRRGIAGATVLSGVDGTFRGRRLRAQFLRRDADVPLMVIAVGAGERIGMMLPELGGLFRRPLMTITKAGVCKRDGHLVTRPRLSAAPAGFAQLHKLTVYTSDAARQDGHFVHRAIARRLHSAGLSDVAAVRGIWGFHADQAPHGDHFPHRGSRSASPPSSRRCR